MKKLIKKVYNYLTMHKSIRLVNQINTIGINTEINFPISISNPRNLHIEDHVYIGPFSWISCYGQVKIKRGTIIGPRLKIYTGNHNYENSTAIPFDNITYAKQVVIDENVWIGGDVIIMPGVHLGEGCVVAGGSVVTKSFPPCCLIGGNPAKLIKERNQQNYFNLKNQDKIYLKLKNEGVLKQETIVI